MTIEKIETARLTIRNFTLDDVGELHEILGDTETMLNLEPAYDLEKTKTFLESLCIGRHGAVAVVEKQTGKLIGYILCNEVDPGEYELGWVIRRSFWRQGYAYEGCKAVMDHAFRELGAHKVFAETVDGVKSVGLTKKLGMKFDGIQDGLYQYGLLREEWYHEDHI